MRVLVIAVAGHQAYCARFDMNPDGIAYLDLGDAFLNGDFRSAASDYWSPLYPLLLVVFRAFLGFGAELEFQAAHAANFAVFLMALAGLELLLSEMLKPQLGGALHLSNDEPVVARGPLVFMAYPLFLWAMTELIGLHLVTPDALVAALALFASAMIVRIRNGLRGARQGALLGAIVGLGYLAKTPFLFLGAGYLGIAWLAGGAWLAGLKTALAGVLSFGLVAGAWVLAISVSHGELTYGRSGEINYAWAVNGVRHYAFADANQGEHGYLAHAPRKLHKNPDVYEYARPVGGTLPLWFDPGHWYQGLKTSFDLDQQLFKVFHNWKRLAGIVGRAWPLAGLWILCASLCLLFFARKRRQVCGGIADALLVCAVPTAAMAMYMLVVLESRYCGGFLLLFALGVLYAFRIERRRERLLLCVSAVIGVLGAFWVANGVASASMGINVAKRREQLAISVALRRAGIEPGEEIVYLGNPFKAYWARLSRVRIVGSVPSEQLERLSKAKPARKRSVLAAINTIGARYIVATSNNDLPGKWIRMGKLPVCWLHIDESP